MHTANAHPAMPPLRDAEAATALLRLMQLVSPSLPIGSFTYSQGLEWAVEAKWVVDADSLGQWVKTQIDTTLASVDLPLLYRMHTAMLRQDSDALAHWTQWLLASRETQELRQEEAQRGRALVALLGKLDVLAQEDDLETLKRCQAAGFARAAVTWHIPTEQALLGYAWGWLENQILAGVKLIPLGQTEGQQCLQTLIPQLATAVDHATGLDDADLGASAPALSIASSQHHFQYTRLFRS